jgi:hypothetical protein
LVSVHSEGASRRRERERERETAKAAGKRVALPLTQTRETGLRFRRSRWNKPAAPWPQKPRAPGGFGAGPALDEPPRGKRVMVAEMVSRRKRSASARATYREMISGRLLG